MRRRARCGLPRGGRENRRPHSIMERATTDRLPTVVAPLTFQQQWLWGTAERQNTGIIGLRLLGDLDAQLLRRSFEIVIARHGALRTRIVTFGAEPRQEIDEPAGFHLQSIPFDGAFALENAKNARRFIASFFDAQTERTAGKLFEVRLLRLSARERVLVLTIRHIIADAFSIDILFRELWTLYSELVRGRLSPPRDPPVQYADYALWQRETAHAWVQKHSTYWQECLAQAVPAVFPVHPGPKGIERGDVANEQINFGRQLSAAVRDLARRTRTLSAAIVMLAVYVAALSRWCGQKEFVLPFAVAGRHRPEHVEMIGFLSYYLYLPVKLTGDETFLELMSKVSRAFYTALEHQDFARMSAQAPELLLGPSFNWVPGALDSLVGVPEPSLQSQLAGHLEVEPFIDRKSVV